MNTLLTVVLRVAGVLLVAAVIWMVCELARAPLVDENEQPIHKP
jgi:hypothetical protein